MVGSTMKNFLLFGVVLFITQIRDSTTHSLDLPIFPGCKSDANKQQLVISNCTHPINITMTIYKNSFLTLRFENVTIEDIKPEAFKQLPELETIEFDNSIIKNMDKNAFISGELSILSFTNCQFLSNPDILSEDIEELLLTNCKLTEIPKLDQLPLISTLYLDDNRIEKIAPNAFEKLTTLEEIYINNNLLTSFSFDKSLSQLEVLNLAGNKLTTVDENLTKNLKDLTMLNLKNNSISKITRNAFSNLTKLAVINLSYNQLTQVEDDLFENCSHLEKVILDGNKLKVLPRFTTTKQKSIYYFSCNDCGLKNLYVDTFDNLPSLIELYLSHNYIQSLPVDLFLPLTSLKVLDLSKNELLNTDSSFRKNLLLSEIDLSNNKLTGLDPKEYAKLKNLNKLDLRNNNLKVLWTDSADVEPLNRLEVIKVADNNIQELTEQDLKVTPNLKYINLEHNPLTCSMSFAQLISWLLEKEIYSAEGERFLRTNEKLSDEAASSFEIQYDHRKYWETFARKVCAPNGFNEEDLKYRDNVMAKITKIEAERIFLNEITLEIEDIDSISNEEDIVVEVPNVRGLNISQALSITTVFVLTALVVLTLAVPITLIILRRQRNLSTHGDNLPRFKTLKWNSMPGLKKHSGSIYRPLSEEISSPPTPKVSRYEFNSSPTVHTTVNN